MKVLELRDSLFNTQKLLFLKKTKVAHTTKKWSDIKSGIWVSLFGPNLAVLPQILQI